MKKTKVSQIIGRHPLLAHHVVAIYVSLVDFTNPNTPLAVGLSFACYFFPWLSWSPINQ
jgi:hypothetical protein